MGENPYLFGRYDKDNNFGLIKQYLLNYIEIPDENLHTISTEDITLEQSARRYEEDIRRFFRSEGDSIPQFDLIMLGIGEDGHTASLFPGASSLTVTEHLAIAVNTDRIPHNRISLSLPVLMNAKRIMFLVTGANKAKRVKEIIEDEECTLPAALVHRRSKTAYFVMDQGAASLLSDRGQTNNEIL
jgi:6-phosphogluconolactonase